MLGLNLRKLGSESHSALISPSHLEQIIFQPSAILLKDNCETLCTLKTETKMNGFDTFLCS